ncbi:MAG TPA: hypothetical protein VD999_02975 [Vitreimonas sp.]|nr:hypothetical protein [Vitreimonas sp.]
MSINPPERPTWQSRQEIFSTESLERAAEIVVAEIAERIAWPDSSRALLEMMRSVALTEYFRNLSPLAVRPTYFYTLFFNFWHQHQDHETALLEMIKACSDAQNFSHLDDIIDNRDQHLPHQIQTPPEVEFEKSLLNHIMPFFPEYKAYQEDESLPQLKPRRVYSYLWQLDSHDLGQKTGNYINTFAMRDTWLTTIARYIAEHPDHDIPENYAEQDDTYLQKLYYELVTHLGSYAAQQLREANARKYSQANLFPSAILMSTFQENGLYLDPGKTKQLARQAVEDGVIADTSEWIHEENHSEWYYDVKAMLAYAKDRKQLKNKANLELIKLGEAYKDYVLLEEIRAQFEVVGTEIDKYIIPTSEEDPSKKSNKGVIRSVLIKVKVTNGTQDRIFRAVHSGDVYQVYLHLKNINEFRARLSVSKTFIEIKSLNAILRNNPEAFVNTTGQALKVSTVQSAVNRERQHGYHVKSKRIDALELNGSSVSGCTFVDLNSLFTRYPQPQETAEESIKQLWNLLDVLRAKQAATENSAISSAQDEADLD